MNQFSKRRIPLIACSVAIILMTLTGQAFADPPAAEILSVRTISQQPEFYHGWPTLTRQKSGRLLLVWSGRREAHVGPFGTVEWMTSDDDGKSWSWPRTLLDSAIDDRDAGVLETASGAILVTTFSSLAYEPIIEKAERDARGTRLVSTAGKRRDGPGVRKSDSKNSGLGCCVRRIKA
ncbi:hypothetical protein [Thalassoglobus neptunius]|nr:hypothetical protein [Thalassoglobus neptunius]